MSETIKTNEDEILAAVEGCWQALASRTTEKIKIRHHIYITEVEGRGKLPAVSG